MSTAEITHLPRESRPSRRSFRKWLRSVGHDIRHAFSARSEGSAAIAAGAAAVAGQQDTSARNNVVVPFPVRGEALLVQLAAGLRRRFGQGGPDGDPLLFAISRGARLRLTIDGCAYVELQQQGRAFRLAVEAGQDTTLSLETNDIDIIVGFVTRYVGEKLDERHEFEAVP